MAGERSDGTHSAWRPPAPQAAATQPSSESLAGYDDLVEVGRGGDSVVYRARDRALDRDVAIKVLLVDDDARAARFAREVEITVELGRQHPNIVTVLATGTTDSGRPCLVMDFHAGGTLHDRLRSHGPLPVDEVLRIGVVLADALAFAHERHVLHRDVKPQNVLVLPTSWVLADFGIARLAGSEHTASVETFTYRHAAPQILDGLAPTAADDIWSLGSTLYTLLDGRPPFASEDPDDDSALAYLRRARTEPHRPLAAPDSGRIAPLLDRCLAKSVEDRWASAAELRDALQAASHGAWAPDADPAPGRQQTSDRSDAIAPAGGVRDRGPVALSALAHAPGDAETDADATGRVGSEPLDEGVEAKPEPGTAAGVTTAAGTTAARTRRRPVLVLGGVALTIGLLLGLGGALLRDGGDDDPQTAATPPRTEIPSVPPPAQTGDAQVPVAEPGLDFVLSSVRQDGAASLELEWRDPSEGEGYFVLHRSVPAPETLVGPQLAPGTTATTVDIAAASGRHCYYLTVHLVSGDYGTSNVRCVNL